MDGNRRLPVRRPRQRRPHSRRRSLTVRRRRARREGRPVSAHRPHGWEASQAGPRTHQVRLPPRVCEVRLWVAFRVRGGLHRGLRERLPLKGSPSSGTRTESGHSSRLRWVDPEPRSGPGPRGPVPEGPVRGPDGGVDRSRSRARKATPDGPRRARTATAGGSRSRGPTVSRKIPFAGRTGVGGRSPHGSRTPEGDGMRASCPRINRISVRSGSWK